jgi:hypothetical protein
MSAWKAAREWAARSTLAHVAFAFFAMGGWAVFAILVTAHALAGTPEIAATIAVPFTVSTSYAIIYNWGLWRRRRA